MLQDTDPPITNIVDLTPGQTALARGAWQEGFEFFRRALEVQETPEALEGLSTAVHWLGQANATIEARERAYVLYRQRGDRRAAGRLATLLAVDYIDFRGEVFVSDGWVQRARSLLDGLDLCAEQGWLKLYEGHFALSFEHDFASALDRSIQATAIARELGLFDLEMLALALDGLALVHQGSVTEGMRKVDEAAAAALQGEMQDLKAIGVTCCTLIYACEAISDYDRAAQWCQRVQEFARRWQTLPLLAICRNYYASILMWRGEWDQAERELHLATRDLADIQPPTAMEAVAKLAEIRRRQGRTEEALQSLAQAEPHPMALLVRANVMLDDGKAVEASALAERFIRRISPQDVAPHLAALEVLVRSALTAGEAERVRELLREAQTLTETAATMPLRATLAHLKGLAATASNTDEQARRHLEDAVDLFQQCGAPFETARARLDLAELLRRSGRPEAAVQEASAALAAFEKLGAQHDAERSRALLAGLGRPISPPELSQSPVSLGLTGREREVLQLVAEGKSNREIAAQLFLSVRTVERHITNMYGKIGVKSKAEATAFALRHGIA